MYDELFNNLEYEYQKITDKEFVPSLSSANNYYTYQTHFLNLDFNIKDTLDKIKNTVKIKCPIKGAIRNLY